MDKFAERIEMVGDKHKETESNYQANTIKGPLVLTTGQVYGGCIVFLGSLKVFKSSDCIEHLSATETQDPRLNLHTEVAISPLKSGI